MRQWGIGSLVGLLWACALAVAAGGLCCLAVGSTGVHWPVGPELSFRAQAVFDSALVGAGLAAAGVAYQAVLRNPLADPYLLGASSGASLAAFIWRHTLLAVMIAGVFSQQAFAFGGAILSVGIVLAIAGRRGRLEPVTLLLVGVIVNAVNASIFLLVNQLKSDVPFGGGVAAFLVGGLQAIDVRQRIGALALVLAACLYLLYRSGLLNVAVVDDAEALSLGVRIHRLRWAVLGAASLATSAVVAISGPIGFVGLICPHIGRRIVGGDHRRLLPVATAGGALLLMFADAGSRFLAAEGWLRTELPVGVITGLLGGPFFLWLLIRSRSGSSKS